MVIGLPLEIGAVINLVIVAFVSDFPFTLLTMTGTGIPQLTESWQTCGFLFRLLLLFLLLLTLQTGKIKPFGRQIDYDMAVEVNGEGIITISLYYETLIPQFFPDIGYICIIKNIMQLCQ